MDDEECRCCDKHQQAEPERHASAFHSLPQQLDERFHFGTPCPMLYAQSNCAQADYAASMEISKSSEVATSASEDESISLI
ncbi:hypothetical protein ACFXPS_06885 [Nocardia sp. NPDC059091]|uniref:hypothetical protein n=1 Tax=Nocardia sp. NPDC059091 TaxID=3346724 RepID=UPI003699C093